MPFDYTVAGKYTLDMNGGSINLAVLEQFLRQLQEDGEIYIRNVNKEQRSLVEMWAELSSQVNNIKALTIKDGDTLFVNADAVDAHSLFRSFTASNVKVSIVPVAVPYGKTLDECVTKQSA
jgi:hypothetical protein